MKKHWKDRMAIDGECDKNGKKSFAKYKTFAIKAAKDLCYSANIIARIKEAKTETEVAIIMRKARMEEC